MSFLQRLRDGWMRLMQGRYGSDQLTLALLLLALILNLLSAVLGRVLLVGFVLRVLTLALLFVAVFRIFSKNTARRGAENRWFLSKTYPMRTNLRQAWTRFQNRKEYTYFSCPGCKCRMRLSKSVHGTVKITCKQCGRVFEKRL